MQMQTLSARIPTEDLEWLVGLQIQGAVSPSDKLRSLIGQLRRQDEGSLDFQRSLAWLPEAKRLAALAALESSGYLAEEERQMLASAGGNPCALYLASGAGTY